jgi:hypothetical protein
MPEAGWGTHENALITFDKFTKNGSYTDVYNADLYENATNSSFYR